MNIITIHTRARRINYTLYLERFLDFTGWSYEDLYRIQLEDERAALSGDGRSRKRVSLKVREYMAKMIDDGYTATTGHMVYKAVKFFMDANQRNFE